MHGFYQKDLRTRELAVLNVAVLWLLWPRTAAPTLNLCESYQAAQYKWSKLNELLNLLLSNASN